MRRTVLAWSLVVGTLGTGAAGCGSLGKGIHLAEEPPALRASGQVLVDPAGPVEAQPAVEVLAEVRQDLAAVQAGDDPLTLHWYPP